MLSLLMATMNFVAAQTPLDGGQNTPIVRTAGGALRGVADVNVIAFKGIPYATPPIGQLRWEPPQSSRPWQGVRDASHFGNACLQAKGLSEANGGDPGPHSEDCLFLNIWTPKLESSARLPVIVWIHGGAYTFGAGGLPIYDGRPMAAKGAVFVSLNYRLGQLGFFAHPALEKEHPGRAMNFALLDQILALKWVRQNIAEFGGDARNVTIMGQSAGAKSVLALMASPLAQGLFQKAVAMSSYAIPDATREKAKEAGNKFAVAVGLQGAHATVAELRTIPAEKFEEARGAEISNSPVPIGGDLVLPQSIQDAFASGREAHVPLIIGNTSDDSSVILAFGLDPAKVIAKVRGAGVAVKLLYPNVKDEKERSRQTARDLIFTMPVRWAADRHSKLAPTWRYYFDYTAERQKDKFPNGVPHGSEIPYLLNTLDIYEGTKGVLTDHDRQFSREVSDYLFEFARTGVPSSKSAPAWPKHHAGDDETLLMGDTLAPRKDFVRKRLNAFINTIKVLGFILGRK